MVKLFFIFYKRIKGVVIEPGLRVSLWLERDDSYLIPCEFVEISEAENFYKLEVNALDSEMMISMNNIEESFLFGHPGKIIGKGVLIKLGTTDSQLKTN